MLNFRMTYFGGHSAKLVTFDPFCRGIPTQSLKWGEGFLLQLLFTITEQSKRTEYTIYSSVVVECCCWGGIIVFEDAVLRE